MSAEKIVLIAIFLQKNTLPLHYFIKTETKQSVFWRQRMIDPAFVQKDQSLLQNRRRKLQKP